MSLQDLMELSGVPGLSTVVKILTSTFQDIQQVKLYKQQCRDMGRRCVDILLALRDGSKGLEGSKVLEIVDEIESIIMRVDRKVKEWASWNQLKSFLQQGEVKDGIDRLHRDIDSAMIKFNVQMKIELSRGQIESKAIQERDKAELREVLQIIVKSTEDMKALLSMQSSFDSRPVEEIMESLQTELMDPALQPGQEEDFKAGLWMLHEKTSKLPPLTDLTGQITLSSRGTVLKGTFNDIFLGQWLDREPVALRLPRTLANNPDVQHRFQREVSIWRELDHPNVVPLYGVFYMGEDLYSVSPWMDNGNAVAYVRKVPSVDRLKLLTDAASGLEYLHHRGIVHGDFRGANLLISKEGAGRISDFGLSKFLEDCGKGITTSHNTNPRWFAPELVKETGPVSTYSDVWSFAMVCLEILSGDLPYSNIPRDVAVIRELDLGKLPERPGRTSTSQGLSDAMWALMQRCWHKKPESRPSISNVKTALLEIRGLISPIDSSPHSSKRWSRFSVSRTESRPTTSSSDTSVMSSVSGQMLRMGPIRSTGIEEKDELSPLGIQISRGSVKSVEPTRTSSMTSNSVGLDISTARRTSQHRSDLRRSDAVPPRLEVPSVGTSFSLPDRLEGHFPPGRFGSLPYDGVMAFPISKSIHSTNSVHLTGLIREAVSDPRVIVHVTNGIVLSGTLEGLVHRLITNFNIRRDIEYRDVLLTACADFTTPEDLFAILSRRFYEAETSSTHPEDRVALQYNIFMVVMYWLSHQYLLVDNQLLWQMREFCESAIRMKSSTTMVDKARDLLQLITNRERKDSLSPSLLSPGTGRKMLQASQIKPRDLAIALTLLEGDRYKVLLPCDYIAHLRRHPGHNNVEGAYTTNNKINLWVKDSLLHYDSVQDRANVLKFFIYTATECRKLRNFSSLIAIATALHSAPIERLRLTRSELSLQMQGKLDALEDIVNPSWNHRGYRDALNEVPTEEQRDRCVPWLAVHLKELYVILQRYPTTVEVDGRPLINFQRYVKFLDRVKEVVHYTAPDLEQYREQGQLAYLENQLQNLEMSNTSEDQLMARSKKLEAKEIIDYRTRRPQLRGLGFRVT